jgi:hypothetical protein
MLLFLDNYFEKTIAAMILIFFNIVLCGINTLGFFGYDLYGFTASGELVHNPVNDAFFLGIIYLVLLWINIMLLFYCFYLFWKHAKDVMGDNEEEAFYRSG